MAEQVLRDKGLIGQPLPGNGQWYHGRPILITRNDYQLGLYNGDTGLARIAANPSESSANGPQTIQLYFAESERSHRIIPAARIANCETVFAMTVHKSQGSEFDAVHLVLPNADSPVLTRELIYTAVTRARHKVCLWGPESILRSAVKRRIRRRSGLRDALWGKNEES
jgi:exodeoxyribonuclease V alpha subunit